MYISVFCCLCVARIETKRRATRIIALRQFQRTSPTCRWWRNSSHDSTTPTSARLTLFTTATSKPTNERNPYSSRWTVNEWSRENSCSLAASALIISCCCCCCCTRASYFLNDSLPRLRTRRRRPDRPFGTWYGTWSRLASRDVSWFPSRRASGATSASKIVFNCVCDKLLLAWIAVRYGGRRRLYRRLRACVVSRHARTQYSRRQKLVVASPPEWNRLPTFLRHDVQPKRPPKHFYYFFVVRWPQATVYYDCLVSPYALSHKCRIYLITLTNMKQFWQFLAEVWMRKQAVKSSTKNRGFFSTQMQYYCFARLQLVAA